MEENPNKKVPSPPRIMVIIFVNIYVAYKTMYCGITTYVGQ